MRHWLLKSEPEVFSIDDLARARDKRTHWDGVRNYQARNMLRDEMKKGDVAFFYHSNADITGIAGIVEVVREGYPDPSAFDPQDDHFDPKSRQDAPTWYCVDVQLVERFAQVITLASLKANPALAELALVKRGNRLSVMPVGEAEWQAILAMRDT
jgi:predicted RNA-binding protein with PUA-like domain